MLGSCTELLIIAGEAKFPTRRRRLSIALVYFYCDLFIYLFGMVGSWFCKASCGSYRTQPQSNLTLHAGVGACLRKKRLASSVTREKDTWMHTLYSQGLSWVSVATNKNRVSLPACQCLVHPWRSAPALDVWFPAQIVFRFLAGACSCEHTSSSIEVWKKKKNWYTKQTTSFVEPYYPFYGGMQLLRTKYVHVHSKMSA